MHTVKIVTHILCWLKLLFCVHILLVSLRFKRDKRLGRLNYLWINYLDNKSNALAAAHGIGVYHLRECFYNFMKRKIKIRNVWFWQIIFNSNEEIDNVKVNHTIPVKNVTLMFSCLFDGNLVESDTNSTREIPPFSRSCHGNSMTIPCYWSRFCFRMPKHDIDFTEVQLMEFPWHERENDPLNFIGFGVIFN